MVRVGWRDGWIKQDEDDGWVGKGKGEIAGCLSITINGCFVFVLSWCWASGCWGLLIKLISEVFSTRGCRSREGCIVAGRRRVFHVRRRRILLGSHALVETKRRKGLGPK